MLRRASWSERRDDDQTPATAGAREREDTRPVRGFGGVGAVGVGRGGARGQQLADAGDVGGAVAIGEEAVVSDAVEWPLGSTWMRKRRMNSWALSVMSLVAAGPVDPVVLDPEGDGMVRRPARIRRLLAMATRWV